MVQHLVDAFCPTRRTADEAEVRQVLEPYGTVIEIAMIKDRMTSTSKGLATPTLAFAVASLAVLRSLGCSWH